MTIMGSIALILAAVGLYSVMAYSVAQRTQEIGVRMALGAQPRHVLRMVLRQGLGLTAIGLVVGTALTLAAIKMVAGVSFTNSAMGVSALLLENRSGTPIVFLGGAAFLCVIAIAATYLPAHRAASIDPMKALRTD